MNIKTTKGATTAYAICSDCEWINQQLLEPDGPPCLVAQHAENHCRWTGHHMILTIEKRSFLSLIK